MLECAGHTGEHRQCPNKDYQLQSGYIHPWEVVMRTESTTNVAASTRAELMVPFSCCFTQHPTPTSTCAHASPLQPRLISMSLYRCVLQHFHKQSHKDHSVEDCSALGMLRSEGAPHCTAEG